jgi:hypothetical protein
MGGNLLLDSRRLRYVTAHRFAKGVFLLKFATKKFAEGNLEFLEERKI